MPALAGKLPALQNFKRLDLLCKQSFVLDAVRILPDRNQEQVECAHFLMADLVNALWQNAVSRTTKDDGKRPSSLLTFLLF